MTDYSSPYRGVAYFGLWATESADDYGRREAALVLAGAVELCTDEDMRDNREVRDALAYLAAHGLEGRASAFRRALDVQHPHERRQAVAASLTALRRSLALLWERNSRNH